MSLKLIELELTEVRCFAGTHSLELDRALTVVIGKNNTGKTTLLHSAVAFMSACVGSSSREMVQLARGGPAAPLVCTRFETTVATIRALNKAFARDRLQFNVPGSFKNLYDVSGFSYLQRDAAQIRLHENLLGADAQTNRKEDYLSSLADFLAEHWSQDFTKEVRNNLTELTDALQS